MPAVRWTFWLGLSVIVLGAWLGGAHAAQTPEVAPPSGGSDGMPPGMPEPAVRGPQEATGSQASRVPPDWRSYVNERFGFAFRYPPSLSVVESQGEGEGARLLLLRLRGPEKDDPLLRDRLPGHFALEVFANPHRLAPQNWLDAHGWPFGTRGNTLATITVGGLAALDVSTGRMLSPNRYIYLATEHFMIRLTPIGRDAEAILHSFSLLKIP